MRTLQKAVIAFSLFALANGCGWFDYNADEFDEVDKAAKGFENISDDEILAILEGIAAAKAPSFSTETMRAALGALAGVMRPAALTSGGFGLLADEGKDPCQGSNGVQVDNIIGCQEARTRYYYKEVARFVEKATETLGDVTKAVALILGDTNVPTECGTRTEGLTPSEKFQTMLPKKWKGSTLDFILPPVKENGICVEKAGADYRGFEVLIKRPDDAGTLVPVAHLKVQQTLSASTEVKHNTIVQLIANAKEATIPNSDTNTYARLTVRIKDTTNFNVELAIDGLPCSAEYVSIPNELTVNIDVVDGVWAGQQALKTPHLGKSSCEGEGNDEMNFVQNNVADATHLGGAFMMAPYLRGSSFGRGDIASNFCTFYPTYCQDGKITPSLTEAPSTFTGSFCYEGEAAEPIRGPVTSASDTFTPAGCGSLPSSTHLVDFAFRSAKVLLQDQLAAEWATLIEE